VNADRAALPKTRCSRTIPIITRRLPMIRHALVAIASVIAGGTAQAQHFEIPKAAFSMEHCLQLVMNRYPAHVKSVEMESKSGRLKYEFEIKTVLGGVEWEVECSADTGEITQVERDVKPDDDAFKDVARVSEEQALAIAVERVPGTVREIEYEVSPDGRAWYEFTLLLKDGTTTEVMVDAATGDILGVDDEQDEGEFYRIGGDD
jgi:uncharacterized membrane protein YkoI